jgi:hypothetical protein
VFQAIPEEETGTEKDLTCRGEKEGKARSLHFGVEQVRRSIIGKSDN